MPPERRAHRRYLPIETAYAAIGNAFSKVGKIMNFSQDGLSFEYIDDQAQNGGNVTVDIFIIDKPFHIHGLPCKVAYDIKISNPDEPDVTPVKRCCGVQFLTILNDHQDQIITFLYDYTLNTES